MPRADRVHSTLRTRAPSDLLSSTRSVTEQVEQPMPIANRLLEPPAAAEEVSDAKNCAEKGEFFGGIDRLAADRLAGLLQRPDKPTALDPADLLRTLHRLRNEAAREVERLIAIMDEIDADPDFEPCGDESEPELGSVEGRKGFDQSTWAAGADGEPILGSSEAHPHPAPGRRYDEGQRRSFDGSQLGWSTGNADDREVCADLEEDDTHDGREPDVDDEPSGDESEPSLGSFDRLMDQDHAWRQTDGGRFRIMHANMDGERDLSL